MIDGAISVVDNRASLTPMSRIVYATRKSALALAQCRAFVARLQGAHAATAPVEAIELQVVTSGDRIQDRPLSEVGGKGLFVKEIEEKLLGGEADLAVHSIKDVPGELPPGLALVCVPRREDPRDVLVAPRHGDLASLPAGATVGTSSLRRAVALRAQRPDLVIVPLRGNVDTRLRKVDAGDCDAIVLARAGAGPSRSRSARHRGPLGRGLAPRGRTGRARHRSARGRRADGSAPGGARRRRDVALRRRRTRRDGGPRGRLQDTAGPPFAERAGSVDGDRLRLRAFIARPDGTHLRRGERIIPWPSSDAEARAAGLDLGAQLHDAKS